MTSLDPLYRIGDQLALPLTAHGGLSKAAGPQARHRASGTRPHPGSGAPHRLLSARDVRRPAPARDDRDGARQQPGRADRRRADDRARRDRPGAHPRAPRGPAEAPRHVDRVHHARSRRRAPLRRPHLRDEDAARSSKAAPPPTSSRPRSIPIPACSSTPSRRGRKEPAAGQRAAGARSHATSRSRSRSRRASSASRPTCCVPSTA